LDGLQTAGLFIIGKTQEGKLTETVLMKTGMKILIDQLGNVEAERFVSILLREPFDYTKWRKDNLCIGMTVEEISKDAMAIYKQENI
jgi:hypothetical protein